VSWHLFNEVFDLTDKLAAIDLIWANRTAHEGSPMETSVIPTEVQESLTI